METNNAQQQWENYREQELERARRMLAEFGYMLDETQVHIGGERYLMMSNRDVGGGGYKLVLSGRRAIDNLRVIIKFSSDRGGMREIATEHFARKLITNLDFAYHTFAAPRELYFNQTRSWTISIVEYIEQDINFLGRNLEEQFDLALRAFKTQEGVHATTYAHAKKIRSALGLLNANDYLDLFHTFKASAIELTHSDPPLVAALENAETMLSQNKDSIEMYCGFLTHADFVPHNLRVADNQIYLLDYASIHFGNKHESWARFLNFMMLYNPAMEQALQRYVQDNRSPEEYLSLRLMRMYKLSFLLQFYAGTLDKTDGDAHALTVERISFWTKALEAILADAPLSPNTISSYQQTRDSLRSPEERVRQKELH